MNDCKNVKIFEEKQKLDEKVWMSDYTKIDKMNVFQQKCKEIN